MRFIRAVFFTFHVSRFTHHATPQRRNVPRKFRSTLVGRLIATYFGTAGVGAELVRTAGRVVSSTAGTLGRLLVVKSDPGLFGGVVAGVDTGTGAGGAPGAIAVGLGFSRSCWNWVAVRRWK